MNLNCKIYLFSFYICSAWKLNKLELELNDRGVGGTPSPHKIIPKAPVSNPPGPVRISPPTRRLAVDFRD